MNTVLTSPIMLKIFASIFLFLLVISVWNFRHSSKNGYWKFLHSESFASGIFLGAALLHMLPDSAKDFSKNGVEYPFAFLISGSVFLLLLLLEQSTHRLESPKKTSLYFAFLSTVMLSIHAILEGTALGIEQHFGVIILMAFAITAHKSAVGFALSTQLHKSPLPPRFRLYLFFGFSCMTPLGIFIGMGFSSPTDSGFSFIAPCLNSMAAGTFLYLGTLHGLEHANLIKYCRDFKNSLYMLTGFFGMALIAFFI